MKQETLGPVPSRVTDSCPYDGAVTQNLETRNGHLLLFYHQSDIGHTAPDGRFVMRKSTDQGRTWTEPRIIHNELERDIMDPSVVYNPDTGRISLFDVAAGFSEPVESPSDLASKPARENFDTYLLESEDHGASWKDPVQITDRLSGQRVGPFGGGQQTAQGVITFFYSREWELQALISPENGQVWTRHVSVSKSSSGRKLCEPVPCAITESNLLVYGRDNAQGNFFALRSGDGGRKWGGTCILQPDGLEYAGPNMVQKDGSRLSHGGMGRPG